MREFSPFEKDIIRRIAKIYQDGDLNDIELAKIIRTELGAFAVEWDVKKGETTIFCIEKDKAKEYLLKLISIISLLKYLEDTNCLFLTKMSNTKNNDHRLFDREKFKIIPKHEWKGDDQYILDTLNNYSHPFIYLEKTTKDGKINGILPAILTEHSDFAKYMEYYSLRMVYPTQTLIEHVNMKFKTPEQIRFERQLSEANKQHNQAIQKANSQICIARKATIASFIGLRLAIIIPQCTSTKIHKNSTQEIEKIIRDNKVAIPETINTNITNDTLKVDVVNSPIN